MRDHPGREHRIEALFTAHYPSLCRLAYLLVSDRMLAEEIVMDAYLRAFVAWGRIRDLDRADAYLRRTVVNLAHTRSRRRIVERRSNAAVSERAAPAAPWDPERYESDRLVWAAVQSLPHRQRSTVVLRYYLDLPVREIADSMQCSVGTVKSQLAKARATMAGTLGPVHGEEAAPR